MQAVARRVRSRLAARAHGWARARQGEDALPLALVRRRLYILPTRTGIGFTVLVLAMVVAGLNYGNSLALLIAFVLGGFALVAMNLCHRNLLGLRVIGVNAEPAFAGCFASLEIELHNPSAETRHGLLCEGLGAAAPLPAVDAQGTARVRLRVPTATRGVLRLDRIQVSSRFPFGLFRAWTWIHLPIELAVFPAPQGRQAPPPAPGSLAQAQPQRSAGGDEWRDLRNFRDGDSPRQVAWKAYARGLPMMVKEYAGGARETLRFEFAAIAEPDVERRLCQLSRWIVDAEARGARYAVLMPGVVFAESRGSQHQRRCLESLARYGTPGGPWGGAA